MVKEKVKEIVEDPELDEAVEAPDTDIAETIIEKADDEDSGLIDDEDSSEDL